MKNFFQTVGLAPQVLVSLEKMQFNQPTPIQEQAIPLILQGQDILGSAQTGTGKTGAFSIPLVSKILTNQIRGALILTPTRELAVQVLDAICKILGNQSSIKTALLIGGEDIKRQFFQLRRNPRIIVGTPGRINDHLERKTVNLSQCDYLVLDETDRMLDMGFGEQIETIIVQLPAQRQTLMFSATMPKNIEQMSSKYLKNPQRIQIGSCLLPVEAVQQESIRIGDDKKYEQLVKVLESEAGSAVVFVRTKYSAQKIADRLDRDFLKAEALHGDLRQNKRDRVTQGFRAQKFKILVATDVAARGLDVSHVTLVVNYDLPQCPEDYIHRIGRTARAGATGKAINFISGKEENLWRAIQRFMKTGEQGSSSGFGGGQPRNRSRGGNRGRSFGKRRSSNFSRNRFGKHSDKRRSFSKK